LPTTEEQINKLDLVLDGINGNLEWLRDANDGDASVGPTMLWAIACELRALRLMLKDELREATWRMAPLASRKAPDA
jgi:hypothetical protein